MTYIPVTAVLSTDVCYFRGVFAQQLDDCPFYLPHGFHNHPGVYLHTSQSLTIKTPITDSRKRNVSW